MRQYRSVIPDILSVPPPTPFQDRGYKKKLLTSTKTIPEKTSSEEDMGRKDNHGCRNPCPIDKSL